MLVPLVVLAVGAVFAGMAFYGQFVGGERPWPSILGAQSILRRCTRRHRTRWRPRIDAPVWVEGGAAGRRRRRHRARLSHLHPPSRRCRAARRAGSAASTCSCCNKWYFDELYDALFVRPAHLLGRGLWKAGDGAIIDGVGPDGVAAATRRPRAARRRLQTGYVYHYAFAMLIGVVAAGLLVSLRARRGRRDERLAASCRSSPSCRWSARLFILLLRGEPEAVARNARWVGAVDLAASPSSSRCSCGSASTAAAPASSSSSRPSGCRLRHRLPHGRRRHLGAVRAAVDPADADLHPGQLGGDPGPRARNT